MTIKGEAESAMIVDHGLTFREIVNKEPLPKGTIQQAVIDLLKVFEDAAVFGAMAVNAYIDERRMTEVVDILSPRARESAEELRLYLSERFHIAIRVRTVGGGAGFRVYQIVKPKNRHLVDVRPVVSMPPTQRIGGVLVVTPAEVIAGKVISCVARKGKPKSFTDRRDLALMLLKFPELKASDGLVEQSLNSHNANEDAQTFWRELVAEEILPEDEDNEFE
jgi:hypothetical protein